MEQRRDLRCAIYTRKSTEEGLEQQFNSLEAQREAAEAYIHSQQLAGWVALEERYDDGGCSGANLERPAMKLLLQVIEAGRIDCVVVYKVDRLSRSLLDFARLISLFERHQVSFVSVTQEFNTTSSLGRLTLNILLSFAQFEREIISERTRDKLSAARRKGKWIGGIPVLGYDVDSQGRGLVVNPDEAQKVKDIFAICEEAGTLSAGLRQIQERDIQTKRWISRGGRHHTSKPFTKSSLAALLANVLYKGCISHKGVIYPGEQHALIETERWEHVHRELQLNREPRQNRRYERQNRLLQNLVRCGECGAALIATYTRKQGRQHSYYVCKTARCRQHPIGAEDLENSLAQQLEKVLGPQPSTIMIQALEQVIYTSHTRQVLVVLRDDTRFEYVFAVPHRPGLRSGAKRKPGRIPRISKLMALAIKMERLIREGKVSDYAALAEAGQISRPRMTQIMNLLHLSPEIQEALLFLPITVRGPDTITERQLRRVARAVDWEWQGKLFADLAAQSRS